MVAVRAALAQVAPTDATVLILGETGTGKELVARSLHALSRRSARPFVAVSCVALAPGLVTSELFGHEAGAFTGAAQRRIGRFEQAHGGTLFLDEIGELSPELQALLLRVLQERVIERVGGASVPVDVRIVAATHRHLLAEVNAERFRADLFYRLNVFPITVPPLRERPDDLPELVAHLVTEFATHHQRACSQVSSATLRALQMHNWPGNVRRVAQRARTRRDHQHRHRISVRPRLVARRIGRRERYHLGSPRTPTDRRCAPSGDRPHLWPRRRCSAPGAEAHHAL
jgi:formate hydrogenlyase transcriptional activator